VLIKSALWLFFSLASFWLSCIFRHVFNGNAVCIMTNTKPEFGSPEGMAMLANSASIIALNDTIGAVYKSRRSGYVTAANECRVYASRIASAARELKFFEECRK